MLANVIQEIESGNFDNCREALEYAVGEIDKLRTINRCLLHNVAANDDMRDTLLLKRIDDLQKEVAAMRRNYENRLQRCGIFI